MALVDAQKGYLGDAEDKLEAAHLLDLPGSDSSTAQAARKIMKDEADKVPHDSKAPFLS
ncbi:MAG TPA: hypothetical protein VF765_38245 [Polyangiaceae bacterium]